MKRTRLLGNINIEQMSKETLLSAAAIKLAIGATHPRVEMDSIQKIASLQQAQKLFRQAKSFSRKICIALKALEHCHKIGDFQKWMAMVTGSNNNLLDNTRVRKAYVSSLRQQVRKAIDAAKTLREVHAIWIRCNNDILAEEDAYATRKMMDLLGSTTVSEVILIFYSAGMERISIFKEESHHFDILVHACELASAEEAYDALKLLSANLWNNGEEMTLPVRLLIDQASQLYDRSSNEFMAHKVSELP